MQCPSCGHAVSPLLYRCGHCNAALPPPPGVLPDLAVVAENKAAAAPISLTDGLGQVTILFVWISALLDIGALTVLAFALVDPPERLIQLQGRFMLAGAMSAAQWLTVLLFVVWLFRARTNVNWFTDVYPRWGRGWTIGAWFVPLANLLIVPAVVADVARCSADDVRGTESRQQVSRVWTWWTVMLLRAAVGVASFGLLAPLLVKALTFANPTLVHVLACVVPPALLEIVAALLGGRVIGGICREQRQRVQRSWHVGLARV